MYYKHERVKEGENVRLNVSKSKETIVHKRCNTQVGRITQQLVMWSDSEAYEPNYGISANIKTGKFVHY